MLSHIVKLALDSLLMSCFINKIVDSNSEYFESTELGWEAAW